MSADLTPEELKRIERDAKTWHGATIGDHAMRLVAEVRRLTAECAKWKGSISDYEAEALTALVTERDEARRLYEASQAEVDDLRGLLARGIEFVEESAALEKRAEKAEAEVDRLRGGQHSRATAYALVERELDGIDVTGNAHRWYLIRRVDGAQAKAGPLIEAVDKLRGKDGSDGSV
jgi:hypothetical protein